MSIRNLVHGATLTAALLLAGPALADIPDDQIPGRAVPEPTAAIAFATGALVLGIALKRREGR